MLKKTKDLNKKRKHKFSPVHQPVKTKIDFTKKSKLIKGVSVCQVCKKNHLECREYGLRQKTDKKIVVCGYCRKKQKRRFEIEVHGTAKTEDALSRTVSGSYGSNK